MRRILAIIDTDEGYAESLAAYLNKSDIGGLKTISWTSADEYEAHKKSYSISIILADEKSAAELKEDIGNSLLIILTDGDVPDTNIRTGYSINKYRSADTIVRKILAVYSSGESRGMLGYGGTGTHAAVIYSPVGRCGKTTFALAYAMKKAEKGKTLFISLDEYQGIFESIAAAAESDLSDVIYQYRQGDLTWSRLRQSIYSFGSVDYIPPVRYAEDLLQLDPETAASIIGQIARSGGYDYIVIDAGLTGRRCPGLLDICDSIYLPTVPGDTAEAKTEEFMEVLRRTGREDTAGRIMKINLPVTRYHMQEAIRPETYSRGRMSEYVETILRTAETDA